MARSRDRVWGRERGRQRDSTNKLLDYEQLFLFAPSEVSDSSSGFSLWCSCTHQLENPFCGTSAWPVPVTGSGKLTVQHVAHHFKVTVKWEIALWEPHVLVTIHKNFVHSEGKVLTAKCFAGGKMGNQCHKRSGPKHTWWTISSPTFHSIITNICWQWNITVNLWPQL